MAASEVTQQNAALAEQAAAAAQSLQEQSGRLVETVSIFKLTSHEARRKPVPPRPASRSAATASAAPAKATVPLPAKALPPKAGGYGKY